MSTLRISARPRPRVSASQGPDSGPLPPAPGGLAAPGSRGTPHRGLPLRLAHLRPGSRPLPTGAPSTRRAITASGMARAGVLRGRLSLGAGLTGPSAVTPPTGHAPSRELTTPRAALPLPVPAQRGLLRGSRGPRLTPLLCPVRLADPRSLDPGAKAKACGQPWRGRAGPSCAPTSSRGVLWGAGRDARPRVTLPPLPEHRHPLKGRQLCPHCAHRPGPCQLHWLPEMAPSPCQWAVLACTSLWPH